MGTTNTNKVLPQLPLWFLLTTVLALCGLLPVDGADQTPPRTKFKAAVYEHAVILPADPKQLVTREEALSVMQQNLAVYAVQAAEAKRQGADILVFPEDGLYGFRFTWETLQPYLEYIPDPTVIDWVPCDDPTRFKNTEVQHQLSCIAKNNSLYIVANMGDRQPCHPHTWANCNPSSDDTASAMDDAHVQYNTDVAFDPQGKLVARYHKQNLFFEQQFNTPATVELPTFDTPFGRWGMFTCFDILFYEPAVTVIEQKGVANIAFPTAWMDALPLLSSIEFHSAFARGMGVNFLAANIHLPQFRFQGSGVYTPKGQAVFVHNATTGSDPKLLVVEIDVLDRPEPESLERKGEGNVNSAGGQAQRDGGGGEGMATQEDERVNYETAFVSELFHDLFNFVQLGENEGTLQTCNNNICCHLTYSMTPDPNDLFALGAFDGLHTYEGSYYLQICALVRCANQSRESCGSVTNQSSTVFHSLSLRGDFQTQYVYPEVLLSTVDTHLLRLAEADEWSFRQQEINSETGFAHPLLAASLFGRIYSRDDEGITKAPGPEADRGDKVVGDSAAPVVSSAWFIMLLLALIASSLNPWML